MPGAPLVYALQLRRCRQVLRGVLRLQAPCLLRGRAAARLCAPLHGGPGCAEVQDQLGAVKSASTGRPVPTEPSQPAKGQGEGPALFTPRLLPLGL